MTTITLIGAGSVEFTRILLADLIEFPELAGSTITLHDINPERLDTAERISRYTIDATGAELQLRAEIDRRAALDGAEFVVNEIQVGGFEATLRDFEIPKKYGLRQTIGDTIGVGGVFRGLRAIPVLIGIAEDMVELCPSAMLLNYTNPMAMLPWAVWEETRLRNAIGLCHSVQNTHAQIAELVGGARTAARPRLPSCDARPERRGDPHDRRDSLDGRRADRRPRGSPPGRHPGRVEAASASRLTKRAVRRSSRARRFLGAPPDRRDAPPHR
jgi:alpha-galactosidase/6-phospho-beta-glucosidase family protein